MSWKKGCKYVDDWEEMGCNECFWYLDSLNQINCLCKCRLMMHNKLGDYNGLDKYVWDMN